MTRFCQKCQRRFEEDFPLCPFDGTPLLASAPDDGEAPRPASESQARVPDGTARRDAPTLALGDSSTQGDDPASFYEVDGNGGPLSRDHDRHSDTDRGRRVEPVSLRAETAGASLGLSLGSPSTTEAAGSREPVFAPLEESSLELVDRAPPVAGRAAPGSSLSFDLAADREVTRGSTMGMSLEDIGRRQDRVARGMEVMVGFVMTIAALAAVAFLHVRHAPGIDRWEPVKHWSERIEELRGTLAPSKPVRERPRPSPRPSNQAELVAPAPPGEEAPSAILPGSWTQPSRPKNPSQGPTTGPTPILSREQLEQRLRLRDEGRERPPNLRVGPQPVRP